MVTKMMVESSSGLMSLFIHFRVLLEQERLAAQVYAAGGKLCYLIIVVTSIYCQLIFVISKFRKALKISEGTKSLIVSH